MKLSKTMELELRAILGIRPDSVHEEDREPWKWTRGTPHRTALALRRRGLVDGIYHDSIGGCKCRLTAAGIAARQELRGL